MRIRVSLLALAVGLGGCAREQAGDTATAPQSPVPAGVGGSGVLRGLVMEVRAAEGRVSVDAMGRVVRLDACPWDLRGLAPGVIADVDYADYGARRWVVGRGPAEPDRGFAQYGRVVGAVGAVDVPAGSLELGNRTLRAHPDALLPLTPGQRVRVDFRLVDGVDWASHVSPLSDR